MGNSVSMFGQGLRSPSLSFSDDMFSGLIPGLNSVNSPEDELYGQIPSTLITLLHLPTHFLRLFTHGIAFLSRDRSGFGTFVLWSCLVTSVALIAWSHNSPEDEDEDEDGGDTVAPPEYDAVVLGSTRRFEDVLYKANGSEIASESDVLYAEELQMQEVMLASLLPSRISNNAMSPAIQTSPTSNAEPSQFSCGICFEEIESWRKFRNQTCSHSFCYDCTSKHITAKIQDNVKIILCPEVDCRAPLDFNTCRQIIPNDILVKWDESLCKSLIPESQTVYCPFMDCLAMLVNDSGEVIRKIECPACWRSICAKCGVLWHLEFTCEEFERLNAKKKKGKDDDGLVKELAKKKSWRKCPNCKIYVEKTEGCLHITCRCGYEFCYRCGSKWGKYHGGCSLQA
ncbi:hypothetical protein LOK49_LG08G00875 [Camellia lanceoleosa]|uniref:Uncharacterized protein n=1 Tax=Camellia lanceoleosa TaxID=1840588 RepID=A0ACC0GSW0_9ERIC|nr:hypothetical protein LOK49_LG08G00875 [Camellia lanceoleosa]